jgi:isoquinoline 1-oxidoreductase alpha subunit
MTGTKYGCGIAQCGACTVHIDGAPARACQTPVESVGSSAITTIEAIHDTTSGLRVQKAWQDLNVVQCGYFRADHVSDSSAVRKA